MMNTFPSDSDDEAKKEHARKVLKARLEDIENELNRTEKLRKALIHEHAEIIKELKQYEDKP